MVNSEHFGSPLTRFAAILYQLLMVSIKNGTMAIHLQFCPRTPFK
jgi:hypothetical protein